MKNDQKKSRGKKQCPSCKQSWGPRKRVCKCGYDFNVRKSISKSVRAVIPATILNIKGGLPAICGQVIDATVAVAIDCEVEQYPAEVKRLHKFASGLQLLNHNYETDVRLNG